MSKNKNRADKRGGLVEFLSIKAELPSDALSGKFRLEIRGRNTLFIQGCRRILKYSPEQMIMGVKDFSVEVTGQRLICSTYHDGTVTIDGLISGIFFNDGEHGEREN